VNASNLARLLAGRSVAVVGASEKLGMSNNAVLPMLAAGREVHLVNPNRDTVYDLPTAPSLTAIGSPVDSVLALVSAERSIEVVREARELGCGGVVIGAAGFAELGDEGAVLQQRLVEAAGGELAIVGPNCSGFMNVRTGANLFTGGRVALRPGPVALVSQSGFLLRSCLMAGQQRQLGFGVALSSGNEAVCGLADYLSILAADPDTTVVCLVIEKIRDADAFFTALSEARATNTAVIALKLGRTERSRDIMRSHTGAIADESWVYEMVLRQSGVVMANDIDDLLDKAQLLAQLPPSRWGRARSVAVMASSGGVAGIAADLSVEEGVDLPDLPALAAWVHERIPGGGSLNPLDLTGFVLRDPDLPEQMFSTYAHADGVDALVLCWWTGEGDEAWARTLLEPFSRAAATAGIPMVVSAIENAAVGGWTEAYREQGITFCRGLRSTFRALRALDHVATGPQAVGGRRAAAPRGVAPRLIDTPAGRIVGFDDTMALLTAAGVAVAPYVVLPEGVDADPAIAALGDRLVVKLADVPHRTELGAVRLDIRPEQLPIVVRELRELAARHHVPATIAVQAMVPGHGEAFIGVQGRSDLGPVLLFGRGGILLELARKVDGRLLPLMTGEAAALVGEVADGVGVIRGQHAWDPAPLITTVEAVGRLWEANNAWLASADLNPLIVTAGGAVAVDGLLLAD
jgi:acyl-CoA synthetase (NDP forming)